MCVSYKFLNKVTASNVSSIELCYLPGSLLFMRSADVIFLRQDERTGNPVKAMHVSVWSSLVKVSVFFRKSVQRKGFINRPVYAVSKLGSSYTHHVYDIPGHVVRREVSDPCGPKLFCALSSDTTVVKAILQFKLNSNNNSLLSSFFVNKVCLISYIHSSATAFRLNSAYQADDIMDQDVKETGEKRKCENSDSHEKTGRKRRRGGGGKQLRPGERYVPPPQKRNPGVSFSQEHFDETSYYFEGGLRKVYPYYYDFKTYCKGRWIGKTLLEVFSSEFRSEPLEYYQKAAKAGRIRLNDTPVDDLNITLKVPSHFHLCCIVIFDGCMV